MKNSESPKFEKTWKDAFADAEASPSENVWTNIDLQLSRAESGDMKRRVVFYQRLAAALVIFALALGSMGVWYWRQDVNQELAANDVNSKIAGKEKQENYTGQNAGTADKKANGENEVAERIDSADRDKDGIEQVTTKIGAVKNSVLESNLKEGLNENNNSNNITSLDYKPKEGVTNGERKSFIAEQTLAGKPESKQLLTERTANDMKRTDAKGKKIDFAERPIFLASNSLPETQAKPKGKPVEEIESLKKSSRIIVAKAEVKKKKNNGENWFASVGGSAGSYNPQSSSTSVSPIAFQGPSLAQNPTPVSDRSNVGTSYSFGMTFGKKVTQRWMVLSGVNYMNQTIGYNSNIAVLDASNQAKAYTADLASASANVTSTAPYAINSVNEFVSIPLQAGYLLVDRKICLQLNGGMAADFFMRNTLIDQSGRLSDYSESAGTNSTYQTLNWAGLVGTELSYKVATHYRVSLVPGLRYSFNSILKSSTGSTLNPMVWDVGFRFRYIF
jgi:hypothetical protein